MKPFALSIICILFHFYITGQDLNRPEYFQQDIQYDITATLEGRNINAKAIINYKNNSSIALDTIYFHLWMNALSNKNSPFAQQLLKANNRSFYFLNYNEMGRYESITATIDNKAMPIEFLDEAKEIAYIVLQSKISPGQEKSFEFLYSLALPNLITRMGTSKEITQLVHWFPRPAVFDQDGWHQMPYLSWGELYGEYADFNITINHSDSLKLVSSYISDQSHNQSTIKVFDAIDCPVILYPHSPTFKQAEDTYDDITIEAHYYRDHNIWSEATRLAKEVIFYFENQIGPFPYKKLTISQGPTFLSSAMEYPGLIIINEIKDTRQLEYYIAHEVAHQYFYAAIGFNERDEGYMDEGLATYFEDKYTFTKYGNHYYNESSPKILKVAKEPLMMQHAHIHQCNRHQNKPLNTKPQELLAINYGINTYPRASYIFKLMEGYIGEHNFTLYMNKYYQNRKNQHANKIDFFSSIENLSLKSFEWVDYILEEKQVNFYIQKTSANEFNIISDRLSHCPVLVSFEADGVPIDTIINLFGEVARFKLKGNNIQNIIVDPYYIYKDIDREDNLIRKNQQIQIVPIIGQDITTRNEIYVLPLLKYNTSDGTMPSLVLYNSTFPSKNIKWLIHPTYSFLNKQILGEAWIKYDYFIDKKTKNYIQPFFNFKTYSFQKNEIFKYNLTYQKLGGGVNYLILNNEKTKSTWTASFDHINEERPIFESADKLTFTNLKFNTVRLGYELMIKNTIAPTSLNSTLSYLPSYGATNDNFIKIDVQLKKRIFFRSDKSFNIRFWTGYFLLNSKRTSLSFNNQLVRGSNSLIYQAENDYAYDQYIVDRNKGNVNQSFAHLGGGFKTVFNNRNLGQTNNFAFSTNLSCDLPIRYSKYLPLKVYLDAGGYTTPISNGHKLNYLYSAGLTLSYLNDAIQIHIPILNSKSINNIYKEEGTFINRISLSLDINGLNPWNFIDNLNYNL